MELYTYFKSITDFCLSLLTILKLLLLFTITINLAKTIDVYHAATYFAIELLREHLSTTVVVAKLLARTAYRDRFENFARLRYLLVKTAIDKASLDAGHRATVRIVVRCERSDESDKDHKCIRGDADIDLQSFRPPASDQVQRKYDHAVNVSCPDVTDDSTSLDVSVNLFFPSEDVRVRKFFV